MFYNKVYFVFYSVNPQYYNSNDFDLYCKLN